MKAKMKTLVLTLLLASSLTFAQSSLVDIRATGEYRMTTGDTPDTTKQLALVAAYRSAFRQTAMRLQGLPEVKALELSASQLEAYVAGIVEPQEQSTAAQPVNGSVFGAEVVVRLDAADAVRRMGGLRKDQDVSPALVELWKQAESLHQQLTASAAGEAQTRQATLTRLQGKYLAARVSAALAKVEESPRSAREPSKEGIERAMQFARTALTVAADSPDARLAMGDVLMEADEFEAAETEYRKGLATDPASGPGHTKLANTLRLQGRLPEAIVELREAIQIDPNSAAAHSDLGLILRSQQKTSEAVAEYREALRINPDFIEAHNNLAVALAGEGKLPEAVTEFREIIRVDPDSALGHYNLAIALADLDLDEESATALRHVVRINPNHYNARYNLGELFRMDGKYDDSATQFREYLRLAPDIPQNQRNIKRARSLIQSFQNP